jgi:hypothetical protein
MIGTYHGVRLIALIFFDMMHMRRVTLMGHHKYVEAKVKGTKE